MEELRRAALWYFDNSSDEIRNKIINYFCSIDTDGDGQISNTEFRNYVENNIGWDNPVRSLIFSELDSNRNGFLDLDEVKVLFYLVKFRTNYCDACGNIIKEMYFTCYECFLSPRCYDICLTCYGSSPRRYIHEHNSFIDNHGMLMRTRNQLMEQQYHHTYVGLGQASPSAANVAPANQTYMGYGTSSPVATTVAPANQTYMGYGRGIPVATTVAPANQTYMGYGRGIPMATTVSPTTQTYMSPGRTNPMGYMGRGRATQFATTVGTTVAGSVLAHQIGEMINPHHQPAIVPMMPDTSSQVETGPSTEPDAGTDESDSDCFMQ